jgi:two-component system, OmpR family, response regulator ChvI
MTSSVDRDSTPPAAVTPSLLGRSVAAKAIQVLLVEDDRHHRERLANDLSQQGFAVRSFSNGSELLDSLRVPADADVVILDWRLRKTSSIDLLLQLRRRGISLPVVFLSGRDSVGSESLAIDVGAPLSDERLAGVDVLVRRLHGLVEAANVAPLQDLACGNLVLMQAVRRAYWRGRDVNLTLGEYNIVHLLASNAGRYVTYRKVYDRLHYAGFVAGAGEDGYRGNVRSAIKRIRSKFRECDPGFEEIRNYTSFGYCWRKPA